MGRVLVGSIPWVGEVLEEGKNLEACRHLLHPHGAGQSQAGALDGLVAHKVGGQCLQEVVACLVGAASQPGRCGLRSQAPETRPQEAEMIPAPA